MARRTNADEPLALAFACGATIADAAKVAGVSERTAARRIAEPAFKAQVSAIRDRIVSEAIGRVCEGMTLAALTIRKLVSHTDPHVSFKASAKLLEVGIKAQEILELQRRVEALEARMADDSPKPARAFGA